MRVNYFLILFFALVSILPLKKETALWRHTSAGSYSLTTFNQDYVSWGIKNNPENGSINVVEAWKNFKKKKDVTVAIVDTGIDPRHEFLKDNLYFPTGSVGEKTFGFDFSNGQSLEKPGTAPFDTHGHGTNIAGIIKSIFPEVKIIPIKYYNPSLTGNNILVATIKAIKKAIELRVDVINYSGGGPGFSAEERAVLKEAQDKGILVVAAAGNERSDIDDSTNSYYPASYRLSNIISVGAHDQFLKKIFSSNWGSKSVDIMAPGKDIQAPYPEQKAVNEEIASPNRQVARQMDSGTWGQSKKAALMTGTSQATAFVTGVALLLKANYPFLNPEQIREVIITSAKKEFFVQNFCLSGGRLDAKRALELAQKKYAPLELARK